MEITSISNSLIKDIRGLNRKRDRVKKESFMVEGIKVITEALGRDYELKNILWSDRLLELKGGEELYEKIKELNITRKVSEDVLEYISETETPQGIVAVAKMHIRQIEDMDFKDARTLFFLDGLQDPGNMGTIIRSADAFNIDGIIIKSGTVDPYNPKVVRATMGSIFRVPIYYLHNIDDEISKLKESGFKLISTSLEESKDLKDVNFTKSIVTIGNESRGVSEEIFKLSDEYLKIPMPGESESLNAGVAASIIMYEVSKDEF